MVSEAGSDAPQLNEKIRSISVLLSCFSCFSRVYMNNIHQFPSRDEIAIGTSFPSEDLPVPHIMTTKELSRYLNLHEITICKYAGAGQIPAMRIGRLWRFDKDAIDRWIATGQTGADLSGNPKRGDRSKSSEKTKPRKGKVLTI